MTSKITPAEWERQKERVLAMRRSGAKVRGEGGIVNRMKREHGFVASYSQYESQLGKWEERKNLTALEWCRILRVVDQYREAGNAYQVLLNGKKVPEWTLKKKRRIYCGRREYVEAGQISARVLPDCVMICDPRLQNHDSVVAGANILSSQAIDTLNESVTNVIPTDADTGVEVQDVGPGNQITMTDQAISEPVIDIDTRGTLLSDTAALESLLYGSYGHPYANQSLSNVNQSLQIVQSSATTNDAFDNSRAVDHLDAQTFTPVEHAILDLHSPSRLLSPRQLHLNSNDTDLGLNLGPGYSEYSMPFSPALSDQLFSQGNTSITPPLEALNQPNSFHRVQPYIPVEYSNESQNSSSDGQMPIQFPSLEYNVSLSSQTVANADATRSNLAALLPPDASLSTTQLCSRHQALVQAFESPIYRILISSIENNFAGLENVFNGDILKLLRQDPQMRLRLVKYLGQTPRAVAMALIEKLLVLFIEDQDVFTVKELLSIGLVDPDDIICSFQGASYTAIQRSAMLCNSELLLALLHAGANVPRTSHSSRSGPLGLALEAMEQNKHVDLKLVETLLDYGLKADIQTFLAAVELKSLDLIDILLSNLKRHFRSNLEREFPPYLQKETLLSLIKNLHNDAADVIKQLIFMFSAGVIIFIGKDSQYSYTSTFKDKFATVAQDIMVAVTLAAQLGYFNVVDCLLPFTADTAGPLAGAIRNGSQELIRFLINTGADVSGRVCRLEGDLFDTTPLAEAFRGQNDELVHSFSSQVSWLRSKYDRWESLEKELKGFEAALYAASEIGNLSYFRRLLDSCNWVRMRSLMDLLPCLSISIEKGHRQIALALLDAGADETLAFAEYGGFYEYDRHPLFQALHQRNKVVFDAIIECDLDLSLLGPRCLTEAFEGEVFWAIDILLAVRPYEEQMYLQRALSAAIRTKKRSMVDLIFRKFDLPLNLSDYGTTNSTFKEAIENNDVKMIQHLLQLGADPCHAFKPSANNGKKHCAITLNREVLLLVLRAFSTRYPKGVSGLGSQALQLAIQSEDVELLDEMLKAKLDVNARADERTPLGFAIERSGSNRQTIIEKLLSAGADANSIAFVSQDVSHDQSSRQWSDKERRTIVRRTALQEAISTSSKNIVRLLIERGADIRRPARLGLKRTPLQHACENGCIEIVDLLIESGADVNEEPAVRGGATSLQLCAIKGYVGIATKLLKLGADVHAPPSKRGGRSPLQGAAENGRLDMISVLWNAAGICRFSEDDCTRARGMAIGNGHVACSDLIQELLDASEVPTMPQTSPPTLPMTLDDC